jgi:hypothetical protein
MDYGTGDDSLGVVPCDSTGTDRYGTFTRACLRDDAPVLVFDATGDDGWLLAPGPLGFDEGYVRTAVAQAGRFVVEDLVDSTAQWDDSPAAWEGIDAAVGALWGGAPYDVRARPAADDDVIDGLFDIDGWREAQGLRPAPYLDGVPRVSLDQLKVSGISASPLDDDHRHGYAGINIHVDASYRMPAISEDGRTWELVHALSVTVSSEKDTGRASYVEWHDRVTVGARVRGGASALTRLAARPGRTGALVTIDDLTLNVPAGASAGGGSDDGAGGVRDWKWFTLGPGRRLEVDGAGDYAPKGGSDAWIAVPGFDNFRLAVEGASAAAEIGTDDSGRYRVRVDLDVTASDGGSRPYHVEWDSTPDRALVELQAMAASFSVDIHCTVPSTVRACAQTQRSVS